MSDNIIAQLSIDAQVLIERLRDVQVGEIVTYEQMEDWIGRSIRNSGSGRGALYTARKRLIADYDIVFGSISKIGVKRLSDTEIVNGSERTIKIQRRAVRREVRKLSCAKYDKLTDAAKVRFNTNLSIFGVVDSITQSSARKKIESKVANANSKLTMAKTLEVFR